MRYFFRKNIFFIVLFLGFLFLYMYNLSASVYGGDVGDLVTAATVGGVAHPPGYPLFVFLGFLLTRLPFSSPAFAVGLISAVAGSLGVAFFYALCVRLTKSTLVSFLSACILGFSFLYWFYSEIAEVFALNAFFAILLFFLAIVFREKKNIATLCAFFFFLGFSLTNHQTIVLIFPSLFLLIGKQLFSILQKKWTFLFWVVGFFFAGLAPFVYIFFASFHHPIINWDNVHDISSFLHLILRKDYGTFQAGIFETPSFSQRLVTMQIYLQYIVVQLTIPVVLLSLFGFWEFFRKDKILFVSIFLAWILAGPAFLAYAGFPLLSGFILGAYERFALLSSVVFLIPFAQGLQKFSRLLAAFLPKRNYVTLFQAIFFFIPLMLFLYNFPKTNLSKVAIGDTYALDFLSPLPRDAVLFISGDTQIFNTWYMHFARNVRPDVLLYNIGATPLTNNVIATYLVNVPAKKRSEMLVSIMKYLHANRPIFSTTQFQPKTGEKIIWVPFGLSYQMYLGKDTLPDKQTYEKQTDQLWSLLHVAKEQENQATHNLTITEIPNAYGDSLVAAGTFAYSQYQDSAYAIALYEKAKTIAPHDGKIYIALGVIYSAVPGKCEDAVSNLTTAIGLDTYNQLPYFVLYNTYLSCLKDSVRAKEVASMFTKIFQKDLEKESAKLQGK